MSSDGFRVSRHQRQRCLTPCTPVSGDMFDVPITTPPLHIAITKMQNQLREAAQAAAVIAEIYKKRIGNKFLISHLDSLPPSELDIQMDFTEERVIYSELQNICPALRNDYLQLCLLAKCWDFMIQDQIEHEFHCHVTEMRQTKIGLYNSLCTLHFVIQNIFDGRIQERFLSSKIQRKIGHLRTGIRSRQVRNYLVSSKSAGHLEEMAVRYDLFVANVSTQNTG